MLVVHALWSPGRGVLLWAEDGERPATGRSRALRTARPHPFAAPAAALATLHPGTRTQVTLLLPAHAGGPLASRELVRSTSGPAPRGTPELRPWAVPAVAVDPAELDDPAEELRYGASVAHVRAVVAFADDLARRGHVLPTLDRAGPAVRARWRPVVQGIDQAAVEALAATMPPVARAEPAGRANTPADPAALVADALDVLVDAAVRDRLARTGVAHRGGQGVVDAWLTALTSPDDRLPARTALDPLTEALQAWDAVGTEPPGAAHACFRLAEVRALAEEYDDTGDGTHWRLEFLLQSTTDPSLLVPAGQVWAGAADRLIGDPQEVLLAELGRAARVYPPLAPALQTARPDALDLSPEGAHHVLVAGAALLVDAGFAVQLPAGWDGARRVGLRLSARSAPAQGVVVRGGLGREEVATFRWSLAVGDGADATSRRGGDRRARRGEGAAGAAARGLGERGPGRAAPRPRVPPPRRPQAADGRRRARVRRGRAPPTTCRCRSPASTPPAGSATCSPAPRTARSPRSSRPPRSPRSCAPTSSAASPGWRSSPRSGWAPAWPTTWAWARPSSCWRWSPSTAPPRAAAGTRPARARRCCSAPCRWSAPGSARPPASPRTCGCAPTTARAGPAATICARPSRRRTCWSPRTRPPPVTPTTSPRSTGTGSCSTRPRP